jgi:hypothetical protein
MARNEVIMVSEKIAKEGYARYRQVAGNLPQWDQLDEETKSKWRADITPDSPPEVSRYVGEALTANEKLETA